MDLLVEFEENTENLYDVKIGLRVWIKQKLGLESDIAREKYFRPAARQRILNKVIFV